jgi:hypothetical protein
MIDRRRQLLPVLDLLEGSGASLRDLPGRRKATSFVRAVCLTKIGHLHG